MGILCLDLNLHITQAIEIEIIHVVDFNLKHWECTDESKYWDALIYLDHLINFYNPDTAPIISKTILIIYIAYTRKLSTSKCPSIKLSEQKIFFAQ